MAPRTQGRGKLSPGLAKTHGPTKLESGIDVNMSALLESVSASSRVLSLNREEGRWMAMQSIRALEKRVGEALAGERLRGLPNLGTRDSPFYGQRVVRSKERSNLPPDGREVLVITNDGKLVVARRLGMHGQRVEARPVLDEELVVEDLPILVAVIGEVLDRHVALVEKRNASITKLQDLAVRLLGIVANE